MLSTTPENLSAIRPFPLMGISLKGINEFIQNHGGREAFYQLTTDEVCRRYVVPITQNQQCSYCDLMKDKEYVSFARVFISHAWRYLFLDVIDALTKKFSISVSLWFDLFSNNQHNNEPPPFEWWCETFQGAIKRIGSVVMVIQPWIDPIPLTRAWCLWELYCTKSQDSRFEIILPPKEEQGLLIEILKDSNQFFEMLNNVDVRKSTAFKLSDKESIFQAINETVGFGSLNRLVIDRISLLYSNLAIKAAEKELQDFHFPIDNEEEQKEKEEVHRHALKIYVSMSKFLWKLGFTERSYEWMKMYLERFNPMLKLKQYKNDLIELIYLLSLYCFKCQHLSEMRLLMELYWLYLIQMDPNYKSRWFIGAAFPMRDLQNRLLRELQAEEGGEGAGDVGEGEGKGEGRASSPSSVSKIHNLQLLHCIFYLKNLEFSKQRILLNDFDRTNIEKYEIRYMKEGALLKTILSKSMQSSHNQHDNHHHNHEKPSEFTREILLDLSRQYLHLNMPNHAFQYTQLLFDLQKQFQLPLFKIFDAILIHVRCLLTRHRLVEAESLLAIHLPIYYEKFGDKDFSYLEGQYLLAYTLFRLHRVQESHELIASSVKKIDRQSELTFFLRKDFEQLQFKIEYSQYQYWKAFQYTFDCHGWFRIIFEEILCCPTFFVCSLINPDLFNQFLLKKCFCSHYSCACCWNRIDRDSFFQCIDTCSMILTCPASIGTFLCAGGFPTSYFRHCPQFLHYFPSFCNCSFVCLSYLPCTLPCYCCYYQRCCCQTYGMEGKLFEFYNNPEWMKEYTKDTKTDALRMLTENYTFSTRSISAFNRGFDGGGCCCCLPCSLAPSSSDNAAPARIELNKREK